MFKKIRTIYLRLLSRFYNYLYCQSLRAYPLPIFILRPECECNLGSYLDEFKKSNKEVANTYSLYLSYDRGYSKLSWNMIYLDTEYGFILTNGESARAVIGFNVEKNAHVFIKQIQGVKGYQVSEIKWERMLIRIVED